MFFRKKDIDADDAQLVKRFKESGDLEYLTAVFSRYMHLVLGVCLKYLNDREESKDAVMQIFEKLPEALQKHEVENFKSWLHVLSKNFCLMKLRSEKSRQQKHEDLKKDTGLFMETSYELHHENGKAIDEDIDALKECMEKLSAEQKACVSMFYLQEKCYKEIVDLSGYDMKKVKSYIQNGKRNLKICLENKHVKAKKTY